MIGLDTETHLIRPGQQAPKLVCLTLDDGSASLVLAGDALPVFYDLLVTGKHVVGHNIAFDIAVLLNHAYSYDYSTYAKYRNAIFTAISQGQVHCTMIREKLLDLARGRLAKSGMKAALPSQASWVAKKKSGYYTLAGVLHRRLRIDIGDDKGEDAVRMRYSEMDGLLLEQWPEAFTTYAMKDATYARRVAEHQEGDSWAQQLRVEPLRVMADVALRLTECRGVTTDGVEVAKLRARCEDVSRRAVADLQKVGIARLDGTTDTKVLKEMVKAAYETAGEKPPMTDPSSKFPAGQIKTDAETIEALPDLAMTHPLSIYRRSNQATAFLSKYIPALEKGTVVPLHARYNTILETGRTSASDYAQTPPRNSLSCYECGTDAKVFRAGVEHCPVCGQWVGDVRRCYVARPGYVLCSVDYNQLELCTLAQMCYDLLGHSTIGEAINAGNDLHSILGAELMGCDLTTFLALRKAKDPVAVGWRQTAKGGNFGFPGGMQPEAFVTYVRVNYGVSTVDISMAKRIHAVWQKTWYDMPEYFRAIKAFGLTQRGSRAAIVNPRTGLIIGDRGFTAAANCLFQGLAAFGALAAGWRLSVEQFCDESSPLFGSRNVLFLHDEWVAEVPEGSAHEAAPRMSSAMKEEMQQWCPDVRISCEPALMRRWYKGAEAVYENGQLVPWQPK